MAEVMEERPKVKVPKALDLAIAVIAVLMVVYHLASTQYLVFGPDLHQNVHFGFALLLVFLSSMRARKRKSWPFYIFLLLVGTGAVIYMQIYHDDIMVRQGYPITPDLVVGVILIIVAIEATRQSWGIILPIVTIIAILYAFTCQYWPGAFYHSPY
ncbi:MAG: hypothetical protein V1849_03885, partial [Chloroflexota bacterium]